jgi:putative ABC transport system substrate-binding protein
VVAVGTEAFRKLRQLQDAPLVHVMVIPAEAGHGPAGNLSGVSMDIAPGAWLSAIGQLFPGVRRIGLISDPRHTGPFVAEAQRAAADSGTVLMARTVQGPDDVPRALEGMQRDIDLFWMLPDTTVAAPPTVEYLLRFSIQHRIPIITFSKKYLELGAVASLDVDPRDMGAQAAGIVSRIVQEGRTPGREYARRTRLTVNRSAAEKMGVTLGPTAMTSGGMP